MVNQNPNGTRGKDRDYIGTSVASRYFLHITQRRIRQLCEAGEFKTAFKPGTGEWRISRSEVIERTYNRQTQEI